MQIIRFSDVEIDQSLGEIRRGGERIDVEPQVLDLLVYLAERPGRIVSKDELIDGVWDGRIVSDSALASGISAARRAVGDSGKAQEIIKTVSRRGVIFVPSPEISLAEAPAVREAASERPSILVLPFKNLSADPGQAYFSEGIAEDILTSLARFEEIVVIAQQSAIAFHAADTSEVEFSRQLAVDYALVGGVQRADDRVRVTVQLIDVRTQATLWAERFDRDVTDIFALQDEISGVVVNTLVGEVAERHLEQAQAPRQMGAYEHALRAQRRIWSVSRESLAEARAEAEAALKLEPDYARAHALLSWAILTQDGNGWGDGEGALYDKSVAHARIAVALDRQNPWARALLGISTFWRDRETQETLAEVEEGVALNPSNAHLRMFLGAHLAYMGRGAQAVEHLDLAIRLNPLFPDLYLIHRARAYFAMDRLDEALSDARRAAAGLPGHPTAFAMLTVCHQARGELDEARAAAERVVALNPQFTIEFARRAYPYVDKGQKDRFCELLAKAGIPASAA